MAKSFRETPDRIRKIEQDKHTLSLMDLQILKKGLEWINEDPQVFVRTLYHRLVRNHPEVSSWLCSVGQEDFGKDILRYLDMMGEDLRTAGAIQSPLPPYQESCSPWADRPVTPRQLVHMSRIFLAVFSELAQDAWSPAMEFAWRRAIHQAVHVRPMVASSTKPGSAWFPCQKRNRPLSETLMLVCGSLIVLAGSIASFGLWGRYRLKEVK